MVSTVSLLFGALLLLVGIGVLSVWRGVVKMDGNYRAAIKRAEKAMLPIIRAHCADGQVLHFGAVYLNPRHLAFVIKTNTDRDRDRMQDDYTLSLRLREVLQASGYPEKAIPSVGFRFESEETVKREYGGNWYHALK